MTEQQSHDLEKMAAKIDRLERQNRFARRLGVIVAVFAAAFLLLGNSPNKAKTLDAQRLLVRDSSGTVRVEISVSDKTGQPKITLSDTKGKTRFHLGLHSKESVPSIAMLDGKGRLRSSFGLSPSGKSTLRIIGPNKKVVHRLPK